MKKDIRFIVYHKVGEKTRWYVCELEYYAFPECDWILSATWSQRRLKAMKFGKNKAEKIAKILEGQYDEEGYNGGEHIVEEV